MVDADVITGALELAVRAPSLHNSQPWRWVAGGGVLELFADPTRIGRSTDSTGREVLITAVRCSIIFAWRWLLPAGRRSSTGSRTRTTMTTWQRSSSARWTSSLMRIGPAGRRSGIVKRIGFPSRRHRGDIRSNPCLVKQSPRASPTLTSSPMIRGHNWPTHHGSVRKCAATTRPTTPNFSGGRRDRTRHRVFRQVRSYPKRSVNASMWLGTSRPAGTANGARACGLRPVEDSRAVDL